MNLNTLSLTWLHEKETSLLASSLHISSDFAQGIVMHCETSFLRVETHAWHIIIKHLLISECTFADIAFLLDASGSITDRWGYEAWNFILDYVNSFVTNALFHIGQDGVQFAVVSYASYATIHVEFNYYNSVDELSEAIRAIYYDGSATNIADALQQAREHIFTKSAGARSNVKKQIILISDGMATLRASDTIVEAELCKQQGIEILTIGFGDMINRDELSKMSSDDNTLIVPDLNGLPSLLCRNIFDVCGGIKGK